ncbi:MAG: hypothetical protein LBJ92_02525 [Holosporales bacterium]|nr:hypothetical protein [Holosporales bacterium]
MEQTTSGSPLGRLGSHRALPNVPNTPGSRTASPFFYADNHQRNGCVSSAAGRVE